ncbi:UNKNOWN [Stylonychia lemnae]|uniref:Uncharacterized protein n=1 Tax=Stylonychia lemnae TaxID=5949 RepID=A0A078A003_STYLE|nr:UNKNOWN [Stylonychia lemnae]|eukprot:CDW74778.1 UNKNOWN [Stylonychia lemnae]
MFGSHSHKTQAVGGQNSQNSNFSNQPMLQINQETNSQSFGQLSAIHDQNIQQIQDGLLLSIELNHIFSSEPSQQNMPQNSINAGSIYGYSASEKISEFKNKLLSTSTTFENKHKCPVFIKKDPQTIDDQQYQTFENLISAQIAGKKNQSEDKSHPLRITKSNGIQKGNLHIEQVDPMTAAGQITSQQKLQNLEVFNDSYRSSLKNNSKAKPATDYTLNGSRPQNK